MPIRHGSYPRINIAIGLFCLALVALVWLATQQRIGFEREEAIESAMKQNSNLAMAFEKETIRTLKAAAQVAVFVRHQYAALGRSLDLPRYILDGVIRDRMFTIVSVVDERGDIILSSQRTGKVNYADRDFFRFHRKEASDALFVSPPVFGRVSSTWQIPMAIRISKADGRFGGVVVLSVDPEHFTALYQKADLGAQGSVALVGHDGITRARRSGAKDSYGQDVGAIPALVQRAVRPLGSYVARDPLDGVRRVFSYRTLQDYPLTALVGTSKAEIIAEHSGRARIYYAAALFVSALIAGFAFLVMQSIVRHNRLEARLKHEAHHDGLTGLPNRTLFLDRLDQQMMHARRNRRVVGLLFVDLDRFKEINDTYGHPSGDALLRETALRLRECLRGSDTVARFGGDEFAVLAGDHADGAELRPVAEKVLAALGQPISIAGRPVAVSASVGVALYPADGQDDDTLLRNADVALLRAKQQGRNRVQFYDEASIATARRA